MRYIYVQPSPNCLAQQRTRVGLQDEAETIVEILSRLRPPIAVDNTQITYTWRKQIARQRYLMVFKNQSALVCTHLVTTIPLFGYGSVTWKMMFSQHTDELLAATPFVNEKNKGRKLIAVASRTYKPHTIVLPQKDRKQDLYQLIGKVQKVLELTLTDRAILTAMFDVLGPRIQNLEQARQMIIGAVTALIEKYPWKQLPPTFSPHTVIDTIGFDDMQHLAYPTIDPTTSTNWQLGRQAVYVLLSDQPANTTPPTETTCTPPTGNFPLPKYSHRATVFTLSPGGEIIKIIR